MQKFSLNDGPGIRTVVFFKGCPLRCRWCSNPESQRPEAEKLNLGNEECREMTVESILAYCLQDVDFYEESGGGVTLSGGEALLQGNFALSLLKALKEKEINTAVETTGFVSTDVFRQALPLLDTVLFDIKHYDDRKHREGTGVSNRIILEHFRYAAEQQANVLPRIPVIPGFNDSCEDAKGFADLLCACGIRKAQLLPFHQFGERKYELLGREYAYADTKAIHPEDLKEYREIMLRNGIDAFF